MTQPLRIGVTCYPTFGGSGIVATEIGVSLARRGHRVHFISYDVPGRLDRFQENVFFHEVEVVDYPLFQHGHYALALASKIAALAANERLDLVHAHYAIPHAASAYLAKQILAAQGVKAPRTVTTLHGTDITLVGSDPSFLPMTRFAILASDGVTVPSEFLKGATYERLDIPRDRPIEVIPNFVDLGRYRPPARRDPGVLRPLFHRLEANWEDARLRPRVLIHVSNFRPLKRVDDAVRVLAAVRKVMPAVLVLVGDGPERARVEGLVRELELAPAVCFLGKQQEFLEVLQQSDLFLLPSESESFGLAALEALACGVPVVGFRVGGVPEVVAEGQTGLLFPVGAVEAMAAGALVILQDDERRQRMSLAARADVEKRWPSEPTVDRYQAYYRSVLAGPAR
jgi:N-acetyl-alpha-D-glucosaminyl L-malate synthase BshA